MPLRPGGGSELSAREKGRMSGAHLKCGGRYQTERKTRSLRLAVLSASYGRIERIVPRLRSITSKTSQTDFYRSSNRLTCINSYMLPRRIINEEKGENKFKLVLLRSNCNGFRIEFKDRFKMLIS